MLQLGRHPCRAAGRGASPAPRFFHAISTGRAEHGPAHWCMRSSRKKFVFLFLASGYAFGLATRVLLNQPPDALGASPGQEAWQRQVSTILLPIRLVLVGPIHWLQQDPDPPPPLRAILLAAYWSLLALGIHYLLSRRPS